MIRKSYFIPFLFLMGCSTSPPIQETSPAPMVGDATSSSQSDNYAPAPKTEQPRKSLGTAWGETRYSDITKTPFVRASNSPLIQSAIYYNDSIGIRNVIGNPVPYKNQLINSGGNYLSFGLVNEYGGSLPHASVANRHYVAGEINTRYSIAVQNHSAARLEVVLSIDGLDVMDGKPASLGKRGYLIDPFGHLKVDGFRQSDNTVAAFRFSSVPQSYAQQKHGNPTNVGVIGIAAFEEQGTNWQQLEEVQRRKQANPFPNGYATPP